MALLEIRNIVHGYGASAFLNNVSLQLEEGQIGCLMGPSGAGKTTVLACVAGIERPQSGIITINGKTVFGNGTDTPPEKRSVGMVFQDFALFPHLTVAKNIAFGMGGGGEKHTRLDEMLKLCDLEEVKDAYPHEISGGEQQRAALARALANRPRLLLLDEPFSRLDETLRERLAKQVRAIIKSQKLTALMVTHNQYEAFMLADIGGIIQQGAVCQWDDIYNLYHRPQCAFVAEFVGDGALLNGCMTQDGDTDTVLGILRGEKLAGGLLARAGDKVRVLLRPDDIVLDAENGFPAKIHERVFRGPTTLYSLRLAAGESVFSAWPSHLNFAPGDSVQVRAKIKHLVLFPAV